MKRSTRLIRSTLIAANVFTVLYVVAMRLYAGDIEIANRRATPDMLAQLRDFTTVRINGDVSVDIVQQDSFSVEFLPADTSTGNFVARASAGALSLFASESPADSHIRIGMPVLQDVVVISASEVNVRGFSGDSVNLFSRGVPVQLRDNTVAQWHISTDGNAEVQADLASLRNGSFHVAGQGAISVLE